MQQATLHTSKGTFPIPVETGITVVELAKKHKVTWGHACQRGICAQCRTKVLAGAECLNETTDAEKRRLRKAERQDGYRLGCQIRIEQLGKIELEHRPY